MGGSLQAPVEAPRAQWRRRRDTMKPHHENTIARRTNMMRVLLLTLVAGAVGSKLAIDFSTDEAFSITIDGTPWLKAAREPRRARLRPGASAIKRGRPRKVQRPHRATVPRAAMRLRRRRRLHAAVPRRRHSVAARRRGWREWPVLGPSAHTGVLTFGGRFMETSRATSGPALARSRAAPTAGR